MAEGGVVVGCVVDGGAAGGFVVLGGADSGSASVGSVSRIGAVGRGFGLGASVDGEFAAGTVGFPGVAGVFGTPFGVGVVAGC